MADEMVLSAIQDLGRKTDALATKVDTIGQNLVALQLDTVKSMGEMERDLTATITRSNEARAVSDIDMEGRVSKLEVKGRNGNGAVAVAPVVTQISEAKEKWYDDWKKIVVLAAILTGGGVGGTSLVTSLMPHGEQALTKQDVIEIMKQVRDETPR